jgi:hypothetical protein
MMLNVPEVVMLIGVGTRSVVFDGAQGFEV